MTIDELIERAENEMSTIGEARELSPSAFDGLIKTAQVFTFLAIAKSMNRKVCIDCQGNGYQWKGIKDDKEMPECILCPTCKGRGRV